MVLWRRGVQPAQHHHVKAKLLTLYAQLLDTLAAQGVAWVQVDEPIRVTDLDTPWQHAFNLAYHALKACPVKLLVATYFGPLQDNLHLAANLPVAGLHIDAVHGHDDIRPLLNLLPSFKVLSLGVINGRNVWKTDLAALLDWLDPVASRRASPRVTRPAVQQASALVDATMGQRTSPSWTGPSPPFASAPTACRMRRRVTRTCAIPISTTPTQAQMVQLMELSAQRIPADRLWVNPDCGLKTRQWSEVRPALANMAAAARQLRAA